MSHHELARSSVHLSRLGSGFLSCASLIAEFHQNNSCVSRIGPIVVKKKKLNQMLYPKICVAEQRVMVYLDTEWGTHWEVLRTERKHNV